MSVSEQYALDSMHGVRAPITRLPNELLLEIFEIYYMLTKYTLLYCVQVLRPGPKIDPFTLIRLTHVCHHWRDVVLHSPTLWTDVDINWPSWRFQFIPHEPESQVPLEVYGGLFESWTAFADFISSPFCQQIAVIDIDIKYGGSVCRYLSDIPTSLLSRLQTFHLNFGRNDKNFPALCYHLPNTIRSVKIDGFDEIIERPLSLFMPTLHTLELRLSYHGGIPMDDCICALNKMHHLKELGLTNVFDDQRLGNATSRITLSRLEKVKISDDLKICSAFLEHLDSVSITYLCLCAVKCSSYRQFERFRGILLMVVQRNQMHLSPVGLEESQSSSSASLRLSSTPDLLNIFLDISLERLNLSPTTTTFRLFPLLPMDLSQLQYLKFTNISRHDKFVPTFWWNSTTFSRLTTLSLDRCTLFFHSSILLPLENGDKPFPNLNKLIIKEGSYDLPSVGKPYDDVLSMFQERTPPQVPLEISASWTFRALPEPLFLVMVKGILLSYKEAMEKDASDRKPVRHLWYHYTFYETFFRTREIKRRVTDFEFEPDDFDSRAFSRLPSDFTIKFWSDEGFQ